MSLFNWIVVTCVSIVLWWILKCVHTLVEWFLDIAATPLAREYIDERMKAKKSQEREKGNDKRVIGFTSSTINDKKEP